MLLQNCKIIDQFKQYLYLCPEGGSNPLVSISTTNTASKKNCREHEYKDIMRSR